MKPMKPMQCKILFLRVEHELLGEEFSSVMSKTLAKAQIIFSLEYKHQEQQIFILLFSTYNHLQLISLVS